MKDYSTKIAELRTENRMTQAELGALLNVTSQAVSKWERGLSEPDIQSIKKMCEIFHISFDEFFGVEPEETEVDAENEAVEEIEEESDEENRPDAQPVEHPNQIVMAYCDTCDKPMYNPKEYQVSIVDGIQHTTCLSCAAKNAEKKAATEKAQREARFAAERKYRQDEQMHDIKKGLLWGILGGVVLAVVNLILGLTVVDEYQTVITVVGTILGAYGGYAMLCQLIWTNSVWDVFSFFLRSFRLPGIIFTLDINGLLFLIFVKVFGSIICGILSAILFGIGIVVTSVYAMIIFPFALIKELRDAKQMY